MSAQRLQASKHAPRWRASALAWSCCRAVAVAWVLLLSSLAVSAQTPAAQAPAAPERKSDPRVQQAAAQHRTIAQAHEKAAFCLESGAPEKTCQEALQQACRGIAIGRYCGMKRSRQASAGTP